MSFLPLFCPNPDCAHHQRRTPLLPGEKPWFHRKSHFNTTRNGWVPRFRCKSCGRYFSAQTFSVDYRLRIPTRCQEVLASLYTCQGQRQLARVLGIDASSVARRISRLGAQALGAHARFLQAATPDPEAVFDGFESFARSQYLPLNVNILVGKHSEALFGFNLVFLKRKGRMTANQRIQRDALEADIVRPKGHGSDRAAELFGEYYRLCQARGVEPITFYTDEHRDYPLALKKAGLTGKVAHHTTSSRKARTRSNPLFAVNYVDRQFRKDKSEYVRETTRWAQRPDRMMERVAVYVAWHNLNKPVRVRDKKLKRVTHAQLAGLSKSWVEQEWQRLGRERVFPKREPLREFHRRVWNREDVLLRKDGSDVFGPAEPLWRMRA